MKKLISRFVVWLSATFPKSKHRTTRTIPDEPAVDREVYLRSWGEVMASEGGKIIVAHLRHTMWSEAGATAPDPSTIEAVALWQTRHEGRMEVLESLVWEATHNTALEPKKRVKTRAVGRAPEVEDFLREDLHNA